MPRSADVGLLLLFQSPKKLYSTLYRKIIYCVFLLTESNFGQVFLSQSQIHLFSCSLINMVCTILMTSHKVHKRAILGNINNIILPKVLVA